MVNEVSQEFEHCPDCTNNCVLCEDKSLTCGVESADEIQCPNCGGVGDIEVGTRNEYGVEECSYCSGDGVVTVQEWRGYLS